MPKCPTCEAALPAESDYCVDCGQSLCPACAFPLDDSATACPSCGADLHFYCAECDGEVSANLVICPHCNAPLVEQGPVPERAYLTVPTLDGGEAETAATPTCPSCDEPYFPEEGFCRECGQMLCGHCLQPVDDEDDTCPHCLKSLLFECPLCAAELVAGTEMCPHCQALIPSYCVSCGGALDEEATSCAACGHAVVVHERTSARVIHSVLVGEAILRVAACPECGEQFPVHLGRCPACDYRLCRSCQITLRDEERFCPRCGPIAAAKPEVECPSCTGALSPGADHCPHCQQALCPECMAPVADDAGECAACGAQFETLCPECETEVAASATTCPACGLIFETAAPGAG